MLGALKVSTVATRVVIALEFTSSANMVLNSTRELPLTSLFIYAFSLLKRAFAQTLAIDARVF